MHRTADNLGGLAYTILHLKPFLTRKWSHPLLELDKTTLCVEHNEENLQAYLDLIYKVRKETHIREGVVKQKVARQYNT